MVLFWHSTLRNKAHTSLLSKDIMLVYFCLLPTLYGNLLSKDIMLVYFCLLPTLYGNNAAMPGQEWRRRKAAAAPSKRCSRHMWPDTWAIN